MKNFIRVFLSLNLFLSLACKKESHQGCRSDCISISGMVSTAQNSEVPVDGAHIYLTWESYSVSLFEKDKIELGSVYSDKDGTYHIEVPFKGNKNLTDGEFALHVKKANHLFIYPHTFTLQHADTSFNLNFHLPQKALIEININGFNMSAQSNEISVFPRYNSYMGGYPIGNWIEGRYALFNTSETSGTSLHETAGNQFTILDIQKIKNDSMIWIKDSVYTLAGQTTSVTVSY